MKFDNMGEEAERDGFMKRLAAFNESRGVSMTSSPTISKQPLDLFQLYNVVKEKGGFVEVSKTKSWKEVATICNCMVNPSAAYAIRKQYMKHLLPYECKFDRGGIDHTTLIPQVESKNKKSKDSMSPGHSDSNSQSGFPPTPGSMEPPSSPYPGGPSPISNNYPGPQMPPQPHPGMYPNMMNPEMYPETGGPYGAHHPGYPPGHHGNQPPSLPPPQQAPRQHSPHPGRKKGGSVPSPGSADSNSQGSYPQSSTPVQFEGPYPSHRQPPGHPSGPNYPENYPHQGVMSDAYGASHHPGQPPQPPSNYGHMGAPGMQQPPPRQQSPHPNRKMMKGAPSPGVQTSENSYPSPGNAPMGSHYPPNSNYPQHYQMNSQYPPYPYQQPPAMHGQQPHLQHQQHSQPSHHPQHHQHPQHPQHPQHAPHPQHPQHPHPHASHSHHQQSHQQQHLPLPQQHQQPPPSNYLPPNSHGSGPPKSNSVPHHPQHPPPTTHQPVGPGSQPPAGEVSRPENTNELFQPSTSTGHRRHPSGHSQSPASGSTPESNQAPNRSGPSPTPGSYYGQHDHLRHDQNQQPPQPQQPQQPQQPPVKASESDSSGGHPNSRPNSRPNSTGAASPGASSRGSDSGNSNSKDASETVNQTHHQPPHQPPHQSPHHPSNQPTHPPHHQPAPHHPMDNQRYPQPPQPPQPSAPQMNNYPQRGPVPGPYGNQPNYPPMNDNYRSNGPSNVQMSTHNSPLAQRLLAAKHNQPNQQTSNYENSMYPNAASRLSPNGPSSRYLGEPRDNNFYGPSAPTGGMATGPAPQHPQGHPSYLKRHPDFMKAEQKPQQTATPPQQPGMFAEGPHPGQYGPYPGRPMTPNYPQGGNGPHQMWNRDAVFRAGTPQSPAHGNMATPPWENQPRTDQNSGVVPPSGALPSTRPELGSSGPVVSGPGGWPMNRYPPPPPPGQTPVPQQQHQQHQQHQPHQQPPPMNHGYPPSTQPGYSYPPDHPMNKMNAMQNRMYQPSQMPGGPPMPPKAPSAHLTRLLCSSPSLPSSPTPSPHMGAPRSPHPHPHPHQHSHPHPHQHQQHPHPQLSAHPHAHLPPHPGHPGHPGHPHPGHHPQHPHGPPHHPPLPYGQLMMKRELIFPPGSVEATTPNLSKRRKLNSKDLCPTEAWKLLMSLKSGLLAESTWAIDTLAVLVADDSSYLYFGLQHLPGLLETLLEHYKKCLNDMFEGLFKDTEVSGHIETPLENGNRRSRKWYQIGSEFDELSEDSHDEDENVNESDDCEVDVDDLGHNLEDVNKCRKGVVGRKETHKKLDRAINVNIPKVDQQLKMLKSSLDLTFTSRNGKSVRMENAEAHLFVTDFDKKWDPFKNGFKAGRDHWSKGYGETTDHVITHFEPKEKYLKLVKVIKSKANKSKKVRDKPEAPLATNKHAAASPTTPTPTPTTIATAKTTTIINNVNSIINNKDDVSSNQPLVNGSFIEKFKICDSKLGSSKKSSSISENEKLSRGKSVGIDLDELEDEPENEDDSPLATIHDYYDSISQRCLCLSTLIRNLSFVPGNDVEMSKHPGLLIVLGRLLTLKHTHAVKKSNFTNGTATGESVDTLPELSTEVSTETATATTTTTTKVTCPSSVTNCSSSSLAASTCSASWPCKEEEATIGSTHWWSESIHLLRENTLVTLANISCQLDLDPYSEEISLNILDGLLHWAVCPSSYAQDHLPTTTIQSFTPKRLALESLMKLSIIDSNVDLMLATPPWKRLEKLFNMLAKMLNRNEDQTLREFALVLLTNFAAADSSIARAIALTGYAIPQLIGFIEQSEQSALQVANTQGLNALRDNPELMGTTLDMVRRAAICLRHFARISENRSMILVHQQRLLSLVFSQILDQGVASVIADVIYEVSLHDDSTLPHPHLVSSPSKSPPTSPTTITSFTTSTTTSPEQASTVS